MDRKTENMVSLATAIGANCIPCFDHLYARARELEIEDHEIEKIMTIAIKVKNGATVFMKNAVNEMLGRPPEADQPCCAEFPDECCQNETRLGTK